MWGILRERLLIHEGVGIAENFMAVVLQAEEVLAGMDE
jgi:hypothetical protein